MTILGPLLTILTLLLPFIIQRIDARRAEQPREKIDALLIQGRPVDVAAELSSLYDDAYHSAGQPNLDVCSGKSAAVPPIHD